MTDKPYLSDNVYSFYQKFKEYEHQGIITEVKIGKRNKKIEVFNGKLLMMYEGDEAKMLASRINRRLSQED